MFVHLLKVIEDKPGDLKNLNVVHPDCQGLNVLTWLEVFEHENCETEKWMTQPKRPLTIKNLDHDAFCIINFLPQLLMKAISKSVVSSLFVVAVKNVYL